MICCGCPAVMDAGEGWEQDAQVFLPLLKAVGIDGSFRLWKVVSGTAFFWLRVLDGKTYIWAVCGDAPEAVVENKLQIPSALRLQDILTGKIIPTKNGVFDLSVSAPGARVFQLQ